MEIPRKLNDSVAGTEAGRTWLQDLPRRVDSARRKWALELDAPFAEEANASWVAKCRRENGQLAVLKVGFPHMEAEHEVEALRFWEER